MTARYLGVLLIFAAGVLLLLVCGRSTFRVWLHLYGFHLKHDHILTDKGTNGR